VPSEEGEATIAQAAESLATVPLLRLAFERRGIDAPITDGLRRMLDGETSADDWLESVRATATRRRKSHAA